MVGAFCNITNAACSLLQPCQNSGTCQNVNETLCGYNCQCSSGFRGVDCQNDLRSCRPNTCLYQGNRYYMLARTMKLPLVSLQACVKKCLTPPSSAIAVKVGKVVVVNARLTIAAMSRVRIAAFADRQCSATSVNVWVIAILVSTVRPHRVERFCCKPFRDPRLISPLLL